MIIKSADEKQSQLDELNGFLALPNLSEKQHELISKKIHALKQGALGEKNSEYEINSYLKDSKNCAVIHDLRIEHNGRVVLRRIEYCPLRASKRYKTTKTYGSSFAIF